MDSFAPFPEAQAYDVDLSVFSEIASLPTDHFTRLVSHAYRKTLHQPNPNPYPHPNPPLDQDASFIPAGLGAADAKRIFAELCSVFASLLRASEGGRREILGELSCIMGENASMAVVTKLVSGSGLVVSQRVPHVVEIVDVDWKVEYNVRCSKPTLAVLDHQVLLKVVTNGADEDEDEDAFQVSCGVPVLEELLDKVNDALIQIEEAKAELA